MFVRIDSSSIDDNKLFDMCKTSEFSEDPTAENMQFLDWNNRPETLLHQNFKQKVYDEGGYFVYEEGGVYLGGGGFYPFEGDVNIVVFPVRLYVIPTLGIKKNMEVIQKLIAYMTDVIKTTTEYRGSVFFVNDHNLWRLKSLKFDIRIPNRLRFTLILIIMIVMSKEFLSVFKNSPFKTNLYSKRSFCSFF